MLKFTRLPRPGSLQGPARLEMQKDSQRGFFISPALGGLAILILAVTGFAFALHYISVTIRVNSTASQLKAYSAAASQFVMNNGGTYSTTLPLNGAAATITTVMLQNDGDLDSGVATTNAYGQAYTLQMRYVTQGSGANIRNVIEPMLCTTGGSQIADQDLLRIASKVDAGGTILSSNPTVALGTNGQWSQPLSNFGIAPGAGHLCVGLFYSQAGAVADYLYRNAVTGHPEVNRMNTAIDMNNNAINNASTITALGKITAGGNVEVGNYLQLDGTAVIGQACSPTGLVSQDGNGLILSCQSGIWAPASSTYHCTCPASDVEHWDPGNGYLYIQSFINVGKRIIASQIDVTGSSCGTWVSPGYEQSVPWTLQVGTSAYPVSKTWQCAK